jgi:hypothetical protein
MVRCERQSMTLLRAGCARLWKSAQEKRPDPWEGRWHCRDCLIGAANAGQSVQPVALEATEWRLICSRCLRPAERLVHLRFCLSCFNRNREATMGRNAKGGRPRLCGRLRPVHVVVTRQGARHVVVTEGAAIGPSEVMTTVARGASGRLAFASPEARRWAA